MIFGPRRAGKTYYLFQVMQQLIKSGMQKEEVVYLNFESPRLFDIDFKEIREVITLHRRLFPKTNKPTLFFDEPQNINFWERSVRELYDEGYRIFLSGSSSKLLSKEIATQLRGRTLSFMLFPLSFREFLKMKNFRAENLTRDDESLLRNMLREYIEYGGFPDVVKSEYKINILGEYSDLILFRDSIERHKIRNIEVARALHSYVMQSFGRELSIMNLYNRLKSSKIPVSKDSP